MGRDVFSDHGLEGFEQQDQRDVDTYASYRYGHGWYVEDPGSDWFNPDWARRRQMEVAQAAEVSSPQNTYGSTYPPADVYPGARDHSVAPADRTALDQQSQRQPTVIPNVFLGARDRSVALANRTAFDHQSQHQHPVTPNVPARRTARGQQATQATTAPAARRTALSNVPRMPAALPSNTTQPIQRRALGHGVNRPSLQPNLQIPLAQRPPPPSGFSDQPPARMLAVNYLHPNDDGKPPRRVQWPMDIEISIVEICTFCPDWFQNPEVIARAIRNGWSREALAKVQVRAEGLTTYDDFKTRHGRIQKQISKGGKLIDGHSDRFNARSFRDRHGPQDDLTADDWLFSHSYDGSRSQEWLGDMQLSALYNNVVTWPTGNDRLLMTQCLEFALQNPGRQLDTSHWAWIISSQNLTAPPALPNGQHRDDEALERVNLIPNPTPPPSPPSVVPKKRKSRRSKSERDTEPRPQV